jgi:hypothetical protein
VWPLLDADGDGYLTRDQFVDLLFDCYAGDDPDSPGNVVFGRLSPAGGPRG